MALIYLYINTPSKLTSALHQCPKNQQKMHIKFLKSHHVLRIDDKKISSTNKQKNQDQMLRY